MTVPASAQGQALPRRAARWWNAFFFTEEPVNGAIYFRAFLALWTIGFFLPRLPHLRELYTERGIHVPHPWIARVGGLPAMPLWLVWSCMIVLLVSMVCFAAGYHARKLHPVIVLLLAYLLGYDISTVRGYGQLAFYQWLVAYCLPYDRLREGGGILHAPRWGQRLAMLLFASVYLFSVLAKTIGGEGWLDGKTLFYTLRGHDYGSFLLSAWFPISLGVARVLGWLTLASESFVALGLWSRRTRPWAMLLCAAMHTVMALSMRVSLLFHLLMIGHLPLFFSADTWQRLGGWFHRAPILSGLRRSQW
jgi:hypothetical protein